MTKDSTKIDESSIKATMTLKLTTVADVAKIQQVADILGIESTLPLDAVKTVDFKIAVSEEAAK